MNRRHFLAAATVGLAAPAIARAQGRQPGGQQGVLKSAKASFRLVTLSHDLEQPWSMAFLPDGRMLITERPGRLRVFANGTLERSPLAGVPQVHTGGQAGLLDVCLHPRFAQNRVLYLSYMSPGAGGPTATVARAELGDGGLRGTTVIFEALPRRRGNANLGSRIVFDRAGLMYVSCGDRFQMELAPGARISRAFRGTSPSSWTATVDGQSSAASRASLAIARGQIPFARSSTRVDDSRSRR